MTGLYNYWYQFSAAWTLSLILFWSDSVINKSQYWLCSYYFSIVSLLMSLFSLKVTVLVTWQPASSILTELVQTFTLKLCRHWCFTICSGCHDSLSSQVCTDSTLFFLDLAWESYHHLDIVFSDWLVFGTISVWLGSLCQHEWHCWLWQEVFTCYCPMCNCIFWWCYRHIRPDRVTDWVEFRYSEWQPNLAPASIQQ